MNNITYTIHFDGSSKPNPGIMTSAYIISDDDNKLVTSETIQGGDGTSNLAEYIGLFEGLTDALKIGCKHIKVFGDSELIINQVLGKFKCKKPTLKVYRNKIQELLKQFYTYELSHVSRNLNKEADAMCRKGV
jgi:ribonuclease HI